MKDLKPNKLPPIVNLIIDIIIFSILAWVYFMGIVCPSFESTFKGIYRGIGIGMQTALYFLLIPTYINQTIPDIPHSGAIVSVSSFILSIILLYIIYPLQR